MENNFKVRFAKNVDEIKGKAMRLGTEMAQEHIALAEKELLHLYDCFGHGEFRVHLAVTCFGELRLKYSVSENGFNNIDLGNRSEEYFKLSKLQIAFFRTAYHEEWLRQGFSKSPFDWQMIKLVDLLK